MNPTKVCPKCKLSKELSQYHKHKSTKDGLFPLCKPCNRQRVSEWRKANPQRKKVTNDAWYRRQDRVRLACNRRGISTDVYWEMFAKQEGRCAICQQKSSKQLCIDHCHETGIVRGLLCGSCKCALGHAKDNIELLRKAIEYLLSFTNRGHGEP